MTQKTLSNYADHVEFIPLDAPFKSDAWTSPEQLSAASELRGWLAERVVAAPHTDSSL